MLSKKKKKNCSQQMGLIGRGEPWGKDKCL